MSTTDRGAPSGAPTGAPTGRAARRTRPVPWPTLGYAVAVLALVVPRLYAGSPLWLDEALSVDIARLPVPDLLSALRRDGSPPLYYLLLHAWIAVFGTGDLAVRSLSTVASLAALPAAWAVGGRLGGRPVAASALLLTAASPFAIRYATETRMYALVLLLALLAVLAALRALDEPTWPRLGVVTALSGGLALTHYWALFFLAAGWLLLVARARGEGVRGPAARVALAVPAGGVLFLPWLPSFLFQAAHTGTPWRTAPTWLDLPSTLIRWGGPGPIGDTLGIVLVGLAGWGLRRRAGRWLVALGLAGLVIGLVVCRVQGAAFALRYSAPMVAPAILAAAVGLASLPPRVRRGVGALVVAGSLGVVGFSSLLALRTQAGPTAAVLRTGLGPGDLVVYCPDQLGPAVSRLLPATVDQAVYPTMAGPQLVDWVDYAARNAAASPGAFAAAVDARTTGTVWLVRSDGYLTYGDQCQELDRALADLRGSREVDQVPGTGRDGAYVLAYPPASR